MLEGKIVQEEGNDEKELEKARVFAKMLQLSDALFEYMIKTDNGEGEDLRAEKKELRELLEVLRTDAPCIVEALAEPRKEILATLVSFFEFVSGEYQIDGADKIKICVLKILEQADPTIRSLIERAASSKKLATYAEESTGLGLSFRSFCAGYVKFAMSAGGESKPRVSKAGGKALLNIVSAIYPLEKVRKEILDQNAQSKLPISREDEERLEFLEFLLLAIGNKEVVNDFIQSYTDPKRKQCENRYNFSDLEHLLAETTDDPTHSLDFFSQTKQRKDAFKAIGIAQDLAVHPPALEIARAILQKVELPLDELTDAWWVSGPIRNYAQRIGSNLSRIIFLEDQKKGTPSILFTKNGIRCFARYSPKTLMEQTESLHPGECFGFMATTYEDHNDAFSTFSPTERITEESKKVSISKIRIIEFDDQNLLHLFEHCCSASQGPAKNDEPRQAEFFWINKHGDPTEDTPEFRELVEKEWAHILGIGPNRTPLVLKRRGTVIGNICYGGQSNGPMQVLSQEYGDIVTIGANNEIQGGFYDFSFDREPDGRLKIKINNDIMETLEKGAIIEYRGGKQIPTL